MTDRSLRILLTNDDGIHADGLKALEAIAAALSDDVWLVAPETEQSGASHSLTLHLPLRLRQIEDKRFAVHGTPTDCVMMAVKHILPKYSDDDRPFDLVLSGVNRGVNMADDVTYSGTIAAAMEGTLLRIPSIALSQGYGFSSEDMTLKWEAGVVHAPAIITKLLDKGWPQNVLMNINLPDKHPDDIDEVEVTVQGTRDQSNLVVDHRVDARGGDYFWLGFARKPSNPAQGTDIKAIYEGRISVTPLHLNLSEEHLTQEFGELLNGSPPAKDGN